MLKDTQRTHNSIVQPGVLGFFLFSLWLPVSLIWSDSLSKTSSLISRATATVRGRKMEGEGGRWGKEKGREGILSQNVVNSEYYTLYNVYICNYNVMCII